MKSNLANRSRAARSGSNSRAPDFATPPPTDREVEVARRGHRRDHRRDRGRPARECAQRRPASPAATAAAAEHPWRSARPGPSAASPAVVPGPLRPSGARSATACRARRVRPARARRAVGVHDQRDRRDRRCPGAPRRTVPAVEHQAAAHAGRHHDAEQERRRPGPAPRQCSPRAMRTHPSPPRRTGRPGQLQLRRPGRGSGSRATRCRLTGLTGPGRPGATRTGRSDARRRAPGASAVIVGRPVRPHDLRRRTSGSVAVAVSGS